MTEYEFSEIVKSTKGIILSAIEKYLMADFSHAIDDVAQETYLRAYGHLSKNKFRGDSKITSWLYTIAKNESLRMNKKLIREQEKVKKQTENVLDAKEMQQVGEALFEQNGAMVNLAEIIEQLPVKYRSVLELVATGHSEKEIASLLRIKQGTVKSRVSRAKELAARMSKVKEV